MRIQRRVFPALLLAILATVAPKVLGQRLGQAYPDFELPRIDNRQPVKLSQFRGRKILLIQFASW